MKNSFKNLFLFFDNLKFNYKTAFLMFIIAGGMICIIILSQISIFAIKQDFDVLFDKRTKSLMQLENVKDTYKVNIENTLSDFQKKQISNHQVKQIIELAQEIIDKNWRLYKIQIQVKNENLLTKFIKTTFIQEDNYYENSTLKNSIIKNIDSKMKVIENSINNISFSNTKEDEYTNLNLEINSISIYLTSLINYDLSLAINEKRSTDKIFNIILIFSIISIFIVFLFSVILSILIKKNFKN